MYGFTSLSLDQDGGGIGLYTVLLRYFPYCKMRSIRNIPLGLFDLIVIMPAVCIAIRRSRRGGMAKVEEYAPGLNEKYGIFCLDGLV